MIANSISLGVKIFTGCLVYFLLAGFNSQVQENNKTQRAMKIILEIESGDLDVIFKNKTAAVIRIWQNDNSFGWDNLLFIIKITSTGEKINIVRLNKMGWTKNGPGYFEIQPGDQLKIPVQIASKSWEANKDISKLKNESLAIKAILNIKQTPESKELNVWVGKTESEWLQLNPPHKWLSDEN